MVMFLFTILACQKLPRNSSQLFEKGVASDKFTFTVWNTCQSFQQNCDLSFFLSHLWIFLRLCSFFIILAPQKPPTKSPQVFEKGVASDKFTFTVWNTCSGFWQNCDLSFFYDICEYLWGNVQFLRCFCLKKHQKITTDSLNGCDIL